MSEVIDAVIVEQVPTTPATATTTTVARSEPATGGDMPLSIIEIGKAFSASGMFGCKNAAQGLVLAYHCQNENISPVRVMQTYHIIDGKLSMRADAMLAAFRKAGGRFTWVADGNDGKTAAIRLEYAENSYVSQYTIDDAKQAGLVKGGSAWTKNPGNMLRARAVSNGVRMVMPEVCTGVYTPEELANDEGESAPVAATAKATKAVATVAVTNGGAATATATSPGTMPTVEPMPVVVPTPTEPVAEPDPKTHVFVTSTGAVQAVVIEKPADPIAYEVESLVNRCAVAKKDLGIVSPDSWSAIVEQHGIPVDPVSGQRKLRLGTIDQQRSLDVHLQTLVGISRSAETVGMTDEKWLKLFTKFSVTVNPVHSNGWLSLSADQAKSVLALLDHTISEREKKRS